MSNQKGSQPVYKIKEKKNVYAPMRDGVRLAVDIFRPEAKGKFPALLALSPYGKDIQHAIPPQGPGSFYSFGSLEAGDTNYIVPRGYAHIIGDIRGTGKSEGKYKCMFSKQEAEDGYDLVEWIARQPWCDGNVGMIGISYYATEQLIVATEQPPHLKAIFPFDAPGDFYRDSNYHGGVLNAFNWLLWRQVAIRDFALVSPEEMSPKEFDAALEKAKSNKDLLMYSWIYQTLETPPMQPHFFDILMHPYDGPFWQERSSCARYDKIKIPAYCGSGWWAYCMWHLTGAFRNYLGINAPKKMLIGPQAFLERPFHQYHDTIIKWYDYWLKGIDTGIMDEPPIKLYVMGIDQWRHENEWPLARTRWTKYFLRSWERLSTEPETFYPEPDCFVQQPPIMTSKIQFLSYLTPPLAEDVEVTGPIALYLYAAIDQDDTNWVISFKDVDEHGSERLLTAGWLKASHRALDECDSKPWQPYHPHTEESIEKIEPGKIYEYAIEVRPTSNVFKVGHRIKLEIASIDLPEGFRGIRILPPYHIVSSKTTLHKIYRDEIHPSYLLLPIIPKK